MISDSKISKLLDKWSRKIKLTKKNIKWTNSLSKWRQFIKREEAKIKCSSPFGAVNIGSSNHLIYLNVRKHRNNAKEMENTILHELNHIKFPKLTEAMIRKMTNRVIPT